MRSLRKGFRFLFWTLLLCFSAGLAQGQKAFQAIAWAPVPFDANEPITTTPHALVNPQERAAALALLDHARQNYNFYGPHAPAFTLKVSFSSVGSSEYEGAGS